MVTDTDHGDELGADVAVLGECEEILPRLVPARPDWADVPSVAYVGETGTFRARIFLLASVMRRLCYPAVRELGVTYLRRV